jgi:hypothetical protein
MAAFVGEFDGVGSTLKASSTRAYGLISSQD